jgi:hypothetical protein
MSKRWAIVAVSAVVLTGAVRVIVRGARGCRSGETPLSWSQNGGAGQVVRQNFVSFPVGQSPPGIEHASVSCGTGYVATGGGFGLSGPEGIGGNATEKWIPVFDDPITASNGTASGWEIGLTETGSPGDPSLGNYVLNAFAICSPG